MIEAKSTVGRPLTIFASRFHSRSTAEFFGRYFHELGEAFGKVKFIAETQAARDFLVGNISMMQHGARGFDAARFSIDGGRKPGLQFKALAESVETHSDFTRDMLFIKRAA